MPVTQLYFRMSFDDVQIFVYRGSRAVEIVPGAKNFGLLPTKTARNDQIDKFWWCPNFHVTGVTSRWNRPGAQKNCVQFPTKTVRNDKINEFWWLPNVHVPWVTSRWNRLQGQKMCAIAHENGQKWPNRWVLTMSQFSFTGSHEPLKSSRS